MSEKQTEQDFEHIGDNDAIESRASIVEQKTATTEQALPIDTTQSSVDTAKSSPKNAINFNKYFLYTLVAGLVISALISITAVLIGEFNATMGKALGTTGSMVAHTLVALLLISISTKQGKKSGGLILNTLIFITIASFITSLFGIWDVISGRIVADLYLVYFYSIGAVLWAQLLLEVGTNLMDKATRLTSQIGLGLTALFYGLLVPTTFINYPDRIAEFHLRALAAAAIAVATASVLTTVFHRIHVFKHPETKSLPSTKNGWDIVMAILVLFFGLPIIFSLIASLSVYNNLETYRTTNTPVYSSPSPMVKNTTRNSSDCTDIIAARTDTSVLQYGSSYTFNSYDAVAKSVSLMYSDSDREMSPVYFDKAPQILDAQCKTIAASSLQQNDKVVLYLHTGYQDFFYNGLVGIQKVN